MNFSQIISAWYTHNKRLLPWRETKQPYPIWVSEVILQQTRVDQGLAYYHRFLENFPTVLHLAHSAEQEVLSVWKGLGYYSRARNMHATAKMVVDKLDGHFPSNYKALIELKGIGPYTAAAIASICGNEPVPVVDGNVIRVFSRIFGMDEPVGSSQGYKKVFQKSLGLIDFNDPGTYNQAVMEFGALCCKPRQPLCTECVFQKACFAFNKNRVNELPVPKVAPLKRERFFNYLVFEKNDGSLLMQKRHENDIWKNLWEFPVIETDRLLTPSEVKHPLLHADQVQLVADAKDVRHILTHQVIHARYFYADQPLSGPEAYAWQPDPLKSGLPVSRMIEKFLERSKTKK
jgi:A/G-specific adenine glycosylase